MYLLVLDKRPEIVFLMKTKLDCVIMDSIRRFLGFMDCLAINAHKGVTSADVEEQGGC